MSEKSPADATVAEAEVSPATRVGIFRVPVADDRDLRRQVRRSAVLALCAAMPELRAPHGTMPRTCIVAACAAAGVRVTARGLCRRHYSMALRARKGVRRRLAMPTLVLRLAAGR
jgi:hypothetical protein